MAKGKILIIEDDVDISRLLGIRLKANDYETAFAGDAVTALTVARKERPDLIILDIGLPGGDGLLVMERLKSIAPLAVIPVIVVSAKEPATTEAPALEAGAVRFFQKPFDVDELLAAIREALGEPAGPR